MSFSERLGFVEEKAIQIDSMDEKLRNRLFNLFQEWFTDSHYRGDPSEKNAEISPDRMVQFALDRIGKINEDHHNINNINSILKNNKENWYIVFDIFEYLYEARIYFCNSCNIKSYHCSRCLSNVFIEYFPKQINQILEKEKSGYRMVNGKFVQITSETELDSIKESVASPFESVSAHMEKALALYSDREKPDYENSIKESISAVEAMCCIITGMDGRNATLGNAIEKLEASGVKIHTELKDAYKKLYAYTNQATGIRHGGIDFTDASAEDAKYMLVSCSAFVNYLIEKYSKVKNTTDNQD